LAGIVFAAQEEPEANVFNLWRQHLPRHGLRQDVICLALFG
jgi:hypothetical protein